MKNYLSIKEFETICDELKDYASLEEEDGAWFNDEVDFENWAGDVFYDLLLVFCEKAGIEIEEE